MHKTWGLQGTACAAAVNAHTTSACMYLRRPLPPSSGDGAAVPGGSVHRAELARQQLDIRCPACGRGLSRHDVRALAPRELGAWEAACTESW